MAYALAKVQKKFYNGSRDGKLSAALNTGKAGAALYLTDYHTHTRCSFDSETPLSAQLEQAQKIGLHEFCTTDHCDLIDEHGRRVDEMDWFPILEQYEYVRSSLPRSVNLMLGLEMGMSQTDPDCARRILSGSPLDFVIGSVHNLSAEAGGTDLYYLRYETQEDCIIALDNYFDSLEKLSQLPDCYDVLGHIIYPLRYMTGASGGPPALDRWREQLRRIFVNAVQADRGIEVNTYCGRTVKPWYPVLKLYRECGGKLLTFGSDAHNAENLGKGMEQAQILAREVGFDTLTVYRGRIPTLIKL